MATQITHKDLLDGFVGICNDVCTKISVVRGTEVRWAYRYYGEDCFPVCSPERAEVITLEYDRDGKIALDPELADHPTNAAIVDAEQAVYGDMA